MIDLKKLMCICTALALSFAVSGCSSKKSSESSGSYSNSWNSNGSIKFVTKPVSYEFPEFLEETDKLSQFGRLVFTSFDKSTQSISESTQVPDGFNCDASYADGKLFRFSVGERVGLVNSIGEIVFPAEYSSVQLIRPNLFEFISENGEVILGVTDSSGSIAIVDDHSYDWIYDDNQLSILQTSVANPDSASELSEGVKYTLTTPDSANVYNALFDSVAVYPTENLTGIDCEYAFTAHSGGYYYILVFYDYYNYSVYEGSYGSVDVFISERNGNCSIFSYDHYMQLVSLLSSFKYSEADIEDEKDGDYVVFTFGSEELVSAYAKYYNDGYCEITLNGDDQTVNAYKIPVEGFADTVDWIALILSAEYVVPET